MATLLLIEDNPVVRRNLYDALSETYDCHTADRAEQAFEYLEVETYDVVLTDLVMPGLGGLEVLKRIREYHPQTPVIVISGTGPINEEPLLELGAFAYIQKPFRLEEVEEAILRALAHRNTSQRSKGTEDVSLTLKC